MASFIFALLRFSWLNDVRFRSTAKSGQWNWGQHRRLNLHQPKVKKRGESGGLPTFRFPTASIFRPKIFCPRKTRIGANKKKSKFSVLFALIRVIGGQTPCDVVRQPCGLHDGSVRKRNFAERSATISRISVGTTEPTLAGQSEKGGRSAA